MLSKKNARVLFLVENLPVPLDRRVWMEATSLREAGYEVSVICPKARGFENEYEVIDGVHIYRHAMPEEESSTVGYLREYATALTWELRLALRVWKERGFDVIHICNPPDLLFAVALWFKILRGVKIIYDQHDLVPELYVAKFGRKNLAYHLLRGAERVTFWFADAVIAPNESHREVALVRGGKRREEVFIVRSGPDTARFQPMPERAEFRRGRKFLVGYVGVMGEQEGIDLLLQSVSYIVHELGRSDVQFMLIGGGPAYDRLRSLAEDLGVQPFVDFAGWCYGTELLERLSSCDVCVSTDPKNEYTDRCTMNKVLEYMALAKPIVQFDLLESRRSAGEAALYATPGDVIDFAEKLVLLLGNSGLRETMGREGYSRIREQFEWRHQVPTLLEAYDYVRGEVGHVS